MYVGNNLHWVLDVDQVKLGLERVGKFLAALAGHVDPLDLGVVLAADLTSKVCWVELSYWPHLGIQEGVPKK